jgi:hypothetical protein
MRTRRLKKVTIKIFEGRGSRGHGYYSGGMREPGVSAARELAMTIRIRDLQ